MPDEEKSIIGRVLTIGGVLAAAGIVGLVSMFGQLSAIKAEVVGFRASITSLEAKVESGTANRYTASDAAQDRLTFSNMISDYSKTSHDLIKSILQRVDEQGKEITELREFRAKVESQLDKK